MVTGCGEGEKTERGLRYMPDMYQSPALKSQEAREVKEYNKMGEVVKVRHLPGMQIPVAGTVPRHFAPYHLTNSADDIALSNELINPISPTPSVLKYARDRYEIFCATCHGKDGNALNGYVVEKLSGVPSLNNKAVAEMTDGYIYHVITNGIRRMPNYAAQLEPDERWAVIHYLRVLQQASALDEAEAQALMLDEKDGKYDAFKPQPEPVPEYDAGKWPEPAQ